MHFILHLESGGSCVIVVPGLASSDTFTLKAALGGQDAFCAGCFLFLHVCFVFSGVAGGVGRVRPGLTLQSALGWRFLFCLACGQNATAEPAGNGPYIRNALIKYASGKVDHRPLL